MIRRAVTTTLTSPAFRAARRAPHRVARRLTGSARVVDFFLQIDDPYGPIALHFLGALCERHGLKPSVWLVSSPDLSAAPEPDKLAAYARRDAAALATALGLPPVSATMPAADAVERAQRIAAAVIIAGRSIAPLIALMTALAAPDATDRLAALAAELGEADAAPMIAEGDARRVALGHYLGSVTHHEGDFYWGVDRLHFLEERLRTETGMGGPLICPLLEPVMHRAEQPVARAPTLDFYLSFRSPYTLIAAERIGALATAYGAELRLRPVLPMVMRGLPVPRAKRMYITLDTKREADRHGIRFGTIVDPVGAGVERGLAVLHQAIAGGQGLAFALSFLRGAFADGIDMTTDAGLIKVAERAGVGADTVQAALADDGWRAAAEANRADMFALGLWGVPSFQVDDRPGWWGQDRLWRVEDDLRAALQLTPIDRAVR